MVQCYTKHQKNKYLNDGESFNTELKKVSNRLTGNKLKLNLNKTRSMIKIGKQQIFIDK